MDGASAVKQVSRRNRGHLRHPGRTCGRCTNPHKSSNATSATPATGNGLGAGNGCVGREPSVKYTCTINGKEYRIEIVDERLINVNGRELTVDFKRIGDQRVYSLLLGGQSYDAFIYSAEAGWEVQIKNRNYTVAVEGERSKRINAAAGGRVDETGDFRLNAPMPGLVVAIFVEEEQEIQKGQVLMILEIDENAERTQSASRRDRGRAPRQIG